MSQRSPQQDQTPSEPESSPVKVRLINAACEMLAEIGPRAMSVRSVAARAGVNHGQVHHCFGGKQGLIDAAARHLAEQHYANAHARAAGAPLPPPLTLSEDDLYLRALVRMVLDGDQDTVSRELEIGKSVPAEAREFVMQAFGGNVDSTEIKARLALTYAIELGWAAMEPVVMQLADVSRSEASSVRERAQELSRTFLNELEALARR